MEEVDFRVSVFIRFRVSMVTLVDAKSERALSSFQLTERMRKLCIPVCAINSNF